MSSPLISTKEFTAEDAREALKNSKVNRNLNPNTVSRYLKDMQSGLWGWSDSVIAFDVKGNLVNGQHRMAALKACNNGIKIRFIVAEHWPSQADLDMGRKRSWVDAARLDPKIGVALSTRVGGFARFMITGIGEHNQSHRELAELVKEYKDAISFLEKITKPTMFRISLAPVFGALGRAFYHEDTEKLFEFVNILKGGAWNDECNIAAVKLRERLLAGEKLTTKERWFLTQNAISNFCKGKVVKSLKITNRELYPLPKKKK